MQHEAACWAALRVVDCLGAALVRGVRWRMSALPLWLGAGRTDLERPAPRTSAKRNRAGRKSEAYAGIAHRQGRLAGSAGLVRVARLITTTSHGDVQELSPTPPLPWRAPRRHGIPRVPNGAPHFR